tara:strand:- start:515 stop:1918 length:1404 start_codon:yes stop_codon:yes gene_type:complete
MINNFKLLLIFFLLLIFNSCSVKESKSSKPNIIIILADDLGYGDIGVFGNKNIRTPNIDQMAFEGQKWTNFYAGASVCTPSRAALLTGRLPLRSGLTSNSRGVLFPNSLNGIPQFEITIAEQLKKSNYKTKIVGKWHLGNKEEYFPMNHGFDSWFGLPYSNDMNNVSNMNYWDMWRSNERKNYKNFNVPLIFDNKIIERPVDQRTLTKRYLSESLKFIEENSNDNFFLYLAHSMPHVPLFSSEMFEGKSIVGPYGDAIEEIDYGVGEIINKIKKLGLSNKTIIVFTSENGPWLEMGEEGGTTGILKGGKGSTWEGGIRVPTVIWGPGYIKPGIVDDIGTSMDLFSTFSHLANVEIPNDRIIDGNNLSNVFKSLSKSPTESFFYYWGSELMAVRYKSYKLHFKLHEAYDDKPMEILKTPILYNLDNDPSEKNNIYKDDHDILVKIDQITKKHKRDLIIAKDLLIDLKQ